VFRSDFEEGEEGEEWKGGEERGDMEGHAEGQGDGDEVGWCRLTLSNPRLSRLELSA